MPTTKARKPRRHRWLNPADVVERLRARWDQGEFLSDLAYQRPWQPVSIGLRSPTATELADQFGAVQEWLGTWQKAAGAGVRLEWERVGGRIVGANEVPARVWIDEREAVWRLLGVRNEVARYLDLAETTRQMRAGLGGWVADHPLKVLVHAQEWQRLLAVVDWIEANDSPHLYLRQIDVAGVDTKFVEKYRAILGELLDRVLPATRIDETFQRHQFVGRYRLARKPAFVRLRRLDGGALLGPARSADSAWPGGPTGNAELTGSAGPTGPAELGMRIADLIENPISARHFYVVENEITYLALPPVPDAVAVLGEGYAVARLAPLDWLRTRDLIYWSDLDTHGFVMLDRLREAFPAARSMLMDRETLLDHEAHWGREATPVNADLRRLTPDEAAVYHDLVEGRYGENLRLEQERLRFGAVRAAMTGTVR